MKYNYIEIVSTINWNGYYNLDVYAILIPFDAETIYQHAKISHYLPDNEHHYAKIINLKTFYGSKLNDFIALATVGKDLAFLKSVLAETYFKGNENKMTMVEKTVWAFVYVKQNLKF